MGKKPSSECLKSIPIIKCGFLFSFYSLSSRVRMICIHASYGYNARVRYKPFFPSPPPFEISYSLTAIFFATHRIQFDAINTIR